MPNDVDTTPGRWVVAADESALAANGRVLLREGHHRVAIVRADDGSVYAIADRCPHEGYPLMQGELRDCVLTCAYHNYKFDLRSGRCLMGDEDARVYPVRVRKGRVEVEISDPPPGEAIRRELGVLEDGLARRRMGQVARAAVKSLSLGAAPAAIALAAARFDAERGEYGTTHVLPVAADVLPICDRYAGPDAVLPLLAPLELAAESHVRRPRRESAAPSDPGPDPVRAGERLRELVEAEDAEAAESLLRGALARGCSPRDLEAWLVGVCSDHFLGFGHGLIYVTKAVELLDRVGWSEAEGLLPGLVVSLVSQTREDTLPAWHRYRDRVEGLRGRLGEVSARAREHRSPAPGGLAERVLSGRRGGAIDGVIEALEAGADPNAVADAIARAAAERMLRFDPAIDGDVTVQDDWLDVTHRLTFAHAVRTAVERARAPDALLLLVQAAQFVGMAAPLDDAEPERPRDDAAAGRPSPEEIADLVRQKRAQEALAATSTLVAQGGDLAALRVGLEDHVLDHAAVRPIVVAHLIKTCRVAFDECRLASDPTPVLAFVKLAASPVRERPARRIAHEAIRFVVHDKTPRSLT